MTTKKKATKKTGKAQTKQGGAVGQFYGNQLAAQMQPTVPLPEALKAFDAALTKVQGIRAVLHTIPGAGMQVHEEVKANRARRLADAASALQTAGWTLREVAYVEADK